MKMERSTTMAEYDVFTGLKFIKTKDGWQERVTAQLYGEELADFEKIQAEKLCMLVPRGSDDGDVVNYQYAENGLDRFQFDPPKNKAEWQKLLRHLESVIETLIVLHEHKMTIGMLAPSRFFLDGKKVLKIAGFHLVRPWQEIPKLQILSPEDLVYMPPEYSDRSIRIPDQRADLYSLGALLYFWWTGRPPFAGEDNLAVMHQHLTVKPEPPTIWNARLPATLEKICLALLEKDPDNRYQSAAGLLHDVRKLIGAPEKLTDPEFQLATRYSSDALLIKDKLYGRETELQQLDHAFEHACQGHFDLVLVGGYSGVGKTALVNSCQINWRAKGAFFLQGKFDQYQTTPYSAFIMAFEQLVRQLLFLPESEITAWKARILDALGDNAGVLLEVIPNLELLLGQQPAPEKLNPVETQNRFTFVILQFVRLFASSSKPLVLFIDDWQWCDIPSINLLRLLALDNLPHLLCISAYRDNEVTEAHPFAQLQHDLASASVKRKLITLSPLNETHVNQLVADALGETTAYTAELSAIIYSKTDGNAFFTRQFLLSLWQRKLIAFNHDEQHWIWEVKHIEAEKVSENVIELLTDNFNQLPLEARQMLKTAAFVGSEFDTRLLAEVRGLGIHECGRLVRQIEQSKLIVPLKSSSQKERQHYVFLHDRVQQAAYASKPEQFLLSDQQLHYLIGKTLLTKAGFDYIQPHEKAGHFLRALELVEKSLQEDVADLFIEAGNRAKGSNSPDAAYTCFQAARTLLATNKSGDKQLKVMTGLMESAFLLNRVEEAESMARQAIALADGAVEKSKVYVLQMLFYESLALFEKNIRCGLEALALFDIQVKKDVEPAVMESMVQEAYLEFKTLLGEKQPRDFQDMPELSDQRQAALLDVLVNMNASAYFADLYLFAWCTLRMGIQTLRHGKANSTPFVFNFLGSLLVAMYKEFDLGYAFGKTGIGMMRQLDSQQYKCRTLSIFTIFIQHFKEPLLNGIPILKESVSSGLETGDLPYAGYSMYAQIRDSFLAGPSLRDVLNHCQTAVGFMEKIQNPGLLALMKLFRANLQLLTGNYNEDTAQEEKESLQFLQDIMFFTAIAHHYIFKSWALCILGRDKEALEFLDKNQEILIYASSQPHVPKHYFLQSLVLLRTREQLSATESQQIEQNQQMLRQWSESMPDNFAAEFRLIESLRKLSAGDLISAFEELDHSLKWARTGKLTGVEALVLETGSSLLDKKGMPALAEMYVQQAAVCYSQWGAVEKVTQLRKGRAVSEARAQTPAPAMDYDAHSMLKATRSISAEVSMPDLVNSLLRIVLENAGAERGVLVLREDDDLYVEAEMHLGENAFKAAQQLRLEQTDSIPGQVIAFVARSKQELVLNHPGQFTEMEDPYFKSSNAKSVLAMPIRQQQELIGVLYLENDLLPGIFNENRLEVLRAIASQAAISIANARLYEKTTLLNQELAASREELSKMNELLEERIRDRTRVLREEVDMRKKVEAELQVAKEAADSANQAKSRFLANMSHEIRSPLNAIVGFSQILMNQSRKQELPDTFRKYLNNINVSGQHLSELINDILDLSKIESGKMTLSEEDLNLRQLIQSIFHINKATAKEKGITLHYDIGASTPQYIRSGRSKLKQILMNLLSNAIKFTAAGKNIFLRAGFEDNNIVLEVQDEGIGIEPDQQAFIFDPFVQADASVTREYGGTGLGLSITQKMVELLGGHIELKSKPGEGSLFRVFLPYVPPQRTGVQQVEFVWDKIKIPKNARILVVEDNPMNQEMIKGIFNEMQHDILVANDGMEGVKLANKYQPDLIFMDIHMPGMDGYEAMRMIRQSNKKTPIVALSADAFREQQQEALESGFSDYLTKPIQLQDLIGCLNKYLIKASDSTTPIPMNQQAKRRLKAVVDSLEQTPIYETEKLVELIESLNDIVPADRQEALFDIVYAGDKPQFDEMIRQMKNKLE
ncbi:MAG: AAA family ATPase [Saprospiraceae bacterium]|nr:AAA family ATPase [Saprospiraceae bacterium]